MSMTQHLKIEMIRYTRSSLQRSLLQYKRLTLFQSHRNKHLPITDDLDIRILNQVIPNH